MLTVEKSRPRASASEKRRITSVTDGRRTSRKNQNSATAWCTHFVDRTYHERDSVPLQSPLHHVLGYLKVPRETATGKRRGRNNRQSAYLDHVGYPFRECALDILGRPVS